MQADFDLILSKITWRAASFTSLIVDCLNTLLQADFQSSAH